MPLAYSQPVLSNSISIIEKNRSGTIGYHLTHLALGDVIIRNDIAMFGFRYILCRMLTLFT